MLVLQFLVVAMCAMLVVRYWLAFADDYRMARVVVAAAVTIAWTVAAHDLCGVDIATTVVIGAAIVAALIHDANNPFDEPRGILACLFHSNGRRWPDVAQTTLFVAWFFVHVEAECSLASWVVGGALIASFGGRCLYLWNEREKTAAWA
jgi:hypothetical protein